MLNLEIGVKYELENVETIKLGDQTHEIDSILSNCLTKTSVDLVDGSLNIIVLGECSINKMIYELDMYVDGKTLMIRPTRNVIFNHFSGKIPESRANAGLEHIDDLQMDLIFKVAQVLIDNKSLVLTENEKKNFDYLKQQWQDTTSTTLDTATYEIDYAFNGDGIVMPKGLKAIARENQIEYKTALATFGYEY